MWEIVFLVFLVVLCFFWLGRKRERFSNGLATTPIHVFYINLRNRTDRKRHILRQLHYMRFSPDQITRVDAVRRKNGHLGCALSHLYALQTILEKGYPLSIVVEDDFTFRFPRGINQKILSSVIDLPDWEVCLLACIGRITPVSETTCRVEHCQSTLGYMIRYSYVERLLRFWKYYLDKGWLNNQPYDPNHLINGHKTPIDQSWKILQKREREKWISTRPLLGRQRNNSDSATVQFGSSYKTT